MSKQKAKQKPKPKQKEIILLTQKEIGEKLYKFMLRAIGRKNAVSKRQVFTAIYGSPNNYSDLHIYYLWHRIKRGMNWVRRTTKMFIVCLHKKDGSWGYCVARDHEDITDYIELMKTLNKRQKYMMKKCWDAVDNQWYKQL